MFFNRLKSDLNETFSFKVQDASWICALRYLKTEMLTDSPFLSSRRFSLVCYFATRSLFSFVDTEREPGS